MRRRRVPAFTRRLRTRATVAVVTTAAVALVFVWWSAARTSAASTAAGRAAAAVAAARAARAGAWASVELADAERAMREAEIERRRQQVRWWIPNYATALERWQEAETAAGAAATLAAGRRRDAERTAAESIAAAESAIAARTGQARFVYPGAEPLAWLSLARVRVGEARVHQRLGNLTQAAATADLAFALTQRTDLHTAAVLARYADRALQAAWQKWKRDTIEWSRARKRPAIVVAKEEHRVTLYVNGNVHKVYGADLGFNWVADKRLSGDGATPEGRYRVVAEKRGGATLYYKALLLDYPNAEDRRDFTKGRRAGSIPRGAAIGGLIEIHGEGGRGVDWTKGCVALTNRDMDELMRIVRNGTPVTIIGSDGAGALAALAAEAAAGRAR